MEDIQALSARANKAYALESYEEAADLYADAYEKLAELNGPDSTKNADITFLYGRTLVKIALKKSEVLGGATGTVLQERPASETNVAQQQQQQSSADPHFSFQGDADADDDDDENQNAEGQEDGEEPSVEDDFQDAWEILDLARILYEKKFDASTSEDEKKENKKRLAEIYDLLGEISLENENFDQAQGDLRKALDLKRELYEQTSNQVSGAHYMLALALEYCTSEEARKEAVTQVEYAIASFKGRIATLEKATPAYKDETEMLEELQLKLSDLKAPKSDATRELVKQVFSGEGAALKDTVLQAMQNSNDLSSLVRKKEKKRPANASDNAGDSKKSKVEVEDSK